ncbi:B3 domain-containing transcription factor VRN1-like [Abrus precatorius]|uniref:B3 domain-containing transcription factor VRN1-like n=1 Tax=Abrus precatorius TaxID=3816 RepID=A0A8B8JV97_ABRPR|nr:B3 domain-containing transcription factor VRN1-like [Abrus precatorius]
MTSGLSHGDGSHGNTTSKPTHFFRIILPDTLLHGKLRIPAKFVRKYGEHLSNTMFLKLSNGTEWKVNLEKREGNVWFEKGWKEFVECHSLAHGHFLVFRYDGTSHFHVLIFDMSTMEIDYPVNKVNRKRASNSEEIQPHKTRKTNGNNRDERNSNLQGTAFHQTFRDYKGRLKNSNEMKRNIDLHTERSAISKCVAREAARDTSFTMIIKSCHLNRKSLYLPKGSLKGYIKPGVQNVMLLVGNKSWTVTLIHYQNKSTSYFSANWSAFARENNLEKGDACLFQGLNNGDDIVMKVSISKRSSVKPEVVLT